MLSRDHCHWLRRLLRSPPNKGCWIDGRQVVALRMIMLDDDPTTIALVILQLKLNAYILRKVGGFWTWAGTKIAAKPPEKQCWKEDPKPCAGLRQWSSGRAKGQST